MVFAVAKNELNRFIYAVDLNEYEEVTDFENTTGRKGWTLYLECYHVSLCDGAKEISMNDSQI